MFYYTAVMKSRRKIPLSPAAMRQARMTIAVAKIKSLGDSTRDSWYSDRTLKAINMSLEELWDWKYDRWSIYLTKQDQTFLCNNLLYKHFLYRTHITRSSI